MGVTGRPVSGVRYEAELVAAAGTDTEASYRGHVHLPDASYPLELRVVLSSGAVSARVDAAAPGAADLERAAAALARAAVKGAVAAGRALPRKIVRWRG